MQRMTAVGKTLKLNHSVSVIRPTHACSHTHTHTHTDPGTNIHTHTHTLRLTHTKSTVVAL